MAVNCRLYYAALIPIFLYFTFQNRRAVKDPLVFLLAGSLTALPHLFYLFSNFSAYWFNMIGYHLVRNDSPQTLIENYKWSVFLKLFQIDNTRPIDEGQFVILFFASLASLFFYKRLGLDRSLAIAIVIFIVSFLPTPVHLQYFAAVVPFMIVPTVRFANSLIPNDFLTRQLGYRLVSLTVVAAGLAAYFYLGAVGYSRLFIQAENLPGLTRARASRELRIETAQRVAQHIDTLTTPGEVVLSHWPGYLIESHAEPYPGTENHFWVKIGNKVGGPEARRKLKIINRQELLQALSDPKLRIVVIQSTLRPRYFPDNYINIKGFTLESTLDGVEIFIRESN